MPTNDIRILAFDVFGTVVDWHGSVMREVEAMLPDVEGDAFALAWRDGYKPAMARVMSGELGWTRIDDLHRRILIEVLDRIGIAGLSDGQIDHLNRPWHRLAPWPDAVAGLTLQPAQVMLVAAHQDDLAGARACGLATAYVEQKNGDACTRRR